MKLQILRKLIPIACLLVSMNVLAYDFESGGIYYNITSTVDKTVEVTYKDTNYKSYSGEVVIPATVTLGENLYTVTSIGYRAFSGCSRLTSVTISNSVTQIGNSAFYNCTSLKDLKIEDGTEILELGYNNYGVGLFYECPLETVYLGRNLSYNTSYSYGYSPFYNQKALKTITIGNSVTSIGDYAFYGCSGLTSVTFESITPPSIGQEAFYNVNATFKVPYTSIFAYEAIAELKDKTFGGFEVDGIYYRLTSDMEVEVTIKDKNYKSYTGEVVIPSEITVDEKKYNVTSIGENAFANCSGLTSGTIPNSVISVDNYAFDNCISLKDLKIEDGTEILELGYNYYNSNYSTGEGLFYDCPLETVYLGRNLSYNTYYKYGYSPFYNQKALKTITIGNSVTSIGDYAFGYCSGLTSVTISNSVTQIGNNVFEGCTSLKDLKIEDGAKVLNLGYNYYSSRIGDGLFYECPLETVYLGRNLSYNTSYSYGYSPFFYQEALKTITIGNSVTSIGGYAFCNCSGLTSVTIPNSVTSIGGSAFSGCSGLTSVTIPNTVTSVGNYAFERCTSLKDLKIEDGAKVLNLGYNYYSSSGTGKGLFYDCPLETVYLGRHLRYNTSYSYGYSPFYGQKALKTITIGNNVTSIGDYAFYKCSGLTSITIPNSVTSIGGSAFSGCSGLTSITIPNSVTSIGGSAFSDCSGLTSITIPNSVTSIGGNAFSGCSGLTSITIPNSVTSIGSSLFRGCTGLTSITIPNSVTSIGGDAFSGCSGLTGVTIPNSVTQIGNYAFGDCTSLKDLKIEDGTEILELGYNYNSSSSSSGEGLFYDCPLETVYLGRNLSYGYSPFYNQKALKAITIGNSVTSIENNAFRGCSSLTEVVFNAENCTKMGSSSYYVFEDCTTLTDLTIGENVKIIPDYAFSGCSGLTSITIPNSVTSIRGSAFYGCSGLTSITIGNSVTSIGDYAFSGCKIKKAIWLTNTPPQGYANLSSVVHYVANDQYTSLNNVTIYPYLSSMFEVDGIKYVPVSPSERTCDAIDCAYDITATNINIENTVSYKGVAMTLKEIKPYTCNTNDYIKQVKINFSGSIGKEAFRGCSAITSAEIKASIIDKEAFYGCSSLETLTVNAKSLGTSAFASSATKNPASLKIESDTIGESAFRGCSAITSAEIKASIIDKEAFYGCTSLETLTVNAKSLGTSAFASSATKESAIFEISVQTIGDNSFKGCTKVESITLSDNLISIGDNAFERCSNLKEIVIPDAVKSLGGYAFSGCSSLEDITIGASVATIKESAFSGCSKLPEITIPSNVKTIGNNVFNNCTSLATVIINDRDTDLSFGSNDSNPLFYSCPLDSVYIGGNITYPTSGSKGYSPFYRNTNLRSVVITDKETEISENEFYGCSNLKNISMGDGVETIGKWAFSGCSSLDYFAFGSGMKTIGEEAFSDCTAMTKLISRTTTPPTCGTQALDDINKWVCELFVPQSAVTVYQGANQWKEFFFITGTESSGVESTLTDEVDVSVENGNIVIKGADNAMIEIYSLNGQCVYSGIETTISIAAKGLYVVKVNGKSFKVMM